MNELIDIIIHLDAHLNEWVSLFGPMIYVILFLVIFCETGLVVTPFLPGDSLLFAIGALAAIPDSTLSLPALWISLSVAAIAGNIVNYSMGKFIGPRVFQSKDSRWLNRAYLQRTQKFYEKHGGKTIILSRYVPILRTFAPFVAGIGNMSYRRFLTYNLVGGLSWISIFLIAGHSFGNLPVVKQNFHVVIFAIIIVSFVPVVVEFIRAQMEKKALA